MEFANEGDLKQLIKQHSLFKKNFTQEEIINYATQIANSINYIHSKNILHRDIKPENILLSDGMLKLGDFGISKELSSTIDFTNTGVGTPFYISPEICNGKKYNHKSDIWSFGCVLYELMTLERPFNFDTINALIYNIVNSYPERKINDKLYSSDLIDLVCDMMNKNYENRPSIKEILTRLDSIGANRKNSSLDTEMVNSFNSNSSTGQSPVSPMNNILNSNNVNVVFHSKMFSNHKHPIKLSSTSLRSSNTTVDTVHHSSSVPKNVYQLAMKSGSNPEIKKKINRFSFEEKLKQRVFSKEIAPRRKRGYSVNRKELMKNFLIDKYGKEMFSQIEGIANSKEMNYSKKEKKIIELIGSEEFRKTEKYLRYITEL